MSTYRIQDSSRGIIGPLSLRTVIDLLTAGVVDRAALVARDEGAFSPIAAIPEIAEPLAAHGLPKPTESNGIGPRTVMGLLHRMNARRETGRLMLTMARGYRKDIYVRDGGIVFLSSNIASERLGDFLVMHRIIGKDDLAVALEAMRTDRGRLGETLLRLGLLEASELRGALREQQLERLIELCCWRDGEYAFFSGHAYEGADVDLDVGIPELLVRTAREMPLEMLRSYLGQDLERVPSWADRARALALPLDKREREATSRVNGKRTVAEIAEQSDSPQDQRVALAVLHLLVAVGALKLTAPKQ